MKKQKLPSRVWLFVTPWLFAHQVSLHGILQARILEWVAIPFSRGSSQRRAQTWVSCTAGGFFTIWATREAHSVSSQCANTVAFIFSLTAGLEGLVPLSGIKPGPQAVELQSPNHWTTRKFPILCHFFSGTWVTSDLVSAEDGGWVDGVWGSVLEPIPCVWLYVTWSVSFPFSFTLWSWINYLHFLNASFYGRSILGKEAKVPGLWNQAQIPLSLLNYFLVLIAGSSHSPHLPRVLQIFHSVYFISWGPLVSPPMIALGYCQDSWDLLLLVYLLSHIQLFCDSMDCSPRGSSVNGILQARILEWVAIPFSRGSSRPGDQTCVSCISRWILYHWGTWEAHSWSSQSTKIQLKTAFKSVLQIGGG